MILYPKIEVIQRIVAKYYGLDVGIMKAKGKAHYMVKPRMIAMYFARKLTNHSLHEIASCFGRTHGAIIHAEQTTTSRIALYKKFAAEVDAVAKLLTEPVAAADKAEKENINEFVKSLVRNPPLLSL